MSDEPGTVTPREFKNLFRLHPAGVSIITTHHGAARAGFTATSVISVADAPATLAFSVVGTSSAWPVLREASSVVVHFLNPAHAALSTRFATRGIDRFEGVDLITLPTGDARIAEVAAWARVEIVDRISVGTSYLVTGTVTHSADDGTSRLVYVDRSYFHTDGDNRIA